MPVEHFGIRPDALDIQFDKDAPAVPTYNSQSPFYGKRDEDEYDTKCYDESSGDGTPRIDYRKLKEKEARDALVAKKRLVNEAYVRKIYNDDRLDTNQLREIKGQLYQR